MPPERSSATADAVPTEARRTLFVVANSHLDTQWRWTVRNTIRELIPQTLKQNFARLEKFEHYRLSFEGAFRYMLMREYYPLDFERLQHWVAADRWAPAGSMLDAADVNLASPESLIRHILYANAFFEREFGRRCNDLFLPDGFGFGFALPTLAAHCGLKGFSSQKFIKWMAPAEIPFEIGFWRGPDGNGVVAVLDPDGYGFGIDENLADAERWIERIDRLAKLSGVYCGYKYYGIGDRGGAVDERSIAWLGKSLEGGRIEVLSATSGEFFEHLGERQIRRLPEHSGELLLPTHGTGCLTSQAAMKRWNRANEQLAQAAELAAVGAMLLGTRHYPAQQLEAAWIRFLWHQMHDDLTGTSIPAAYRISWNDEVVALNQFAEVLSDSVESIAARLDTEVEGYPVLVFNALGIGREDLVRARLPWQPSAPRTAHVFDGEGTPVPCQTRLANGALEVIFLATVEPFSLAVYEVRQSPEPCTLDTGLAVTTSGLRGPHLVAELDAYGDLAGLVHQAGGEEALRSPARLELLADRSNRWPAWEIRFEDICRPPVATSADRPASIRIVEDGPASVAIEVRRKLRHSSIRQLVSLAAGEAGARLEIRTDIDWRTAGHLLKARFSLTSGADEATYDLGCGTIRRGVNRRTKYEVPAQQWADLSSPGGDFGVSILSDCRYGWDHPDTSTLRLSLVRSPRTYRKFRHQARQDFGRHRLTYALFPHLGDWSDSTVSGHAARLNQPLRAFTTNRHAGSLGRRVSFLNLSTDQVTVRALKKAEEGNGVVLRVQEAHGRKAPAVEVGALAPIAGAWELDGSETHPRRLEPSGGHLSLDFKPYELRTVRLEIAGLPIAPRSTVQIPLPWNVEATSFHGSPPTGDFDGRGRTLPGELLEPSISFRGISFELGPLEPGQHNAVACSGQSLEVPPGSRLWLLGASAGADIDATFELAGRHVTLTIQSYAGFIGQWRNEKRILGWRRDGGAFIKRTPIAWLGTHRH
ncbi:MAG: glycoside hydrolase family 38 C-terminal domain-containing protein, partial [Thermoanaerobaculia bacterium]